MAIVSYPDPRLGAAATLSDGVDDDLRAIGERLLAAVKAENAYGLAGAHIGEVAPVVVICRDPESPEREILHNPRVVAVADETAKGEEGSVSLPGVRVEVARPVWADIAWQDAAGAAQAARLEGFAARVAIHEIEQMQGIFFLERVSRLKRDMALKKAKKLAG